PVIAFGLCNCRSAAQVALGAKILKLSIMKVAEFWRQTTKSLNQAKLNGDDIDGETKADLARERKTIFGLSLYLRKWISCCQQICVEVDAAECCKGEITGLVRDLEGPVDQGA